MWTKIKSESDLWCSSQYVDLKYLQVNLHTHTHTQNIYVVVYAQNKHCIRREEEVKAINTVKELTSCLVLYQTQSNFFLNFNDFILESVNFVRLYSVTSILHFILIYMWQTEEIYITCYTPVYFKPLIVLYYGMETMFGYCNNVKLKSIQNSHVICKTVFTYLLRHSTRYEVVNKVIQNACNNTNAQTILCKLNFINMNLKKTIKLIFSVSAVTK